MREIKFRAWDTINNQYIHHKNISVGIKNINNKNNQFIYEQYTGLKDKNGVEIYEGDIVKEWFNDDYDIYKVEWFVMGIQVGWDLMPEDLRRSEVVGNVHENPELLND